MNFPTKKENEKGFTLAELLIVVAIIAVLVAIAIPIFSAQLEKSNRAVDMQTARSVQSAIGVAYSQGRISVPANLQNRPNAQGVWVTICRDENSKPADYGKVGTTFCGADQGVIIDGKKASGGTGTSNKQTEKLLAECGLDPANLSLKSNGGDDGWDWIVIEVGFVNGQLQTRMYSGYAGKSSAMGDANNKPGTTNLEKQIGTNA